MEYIRLSMLYKKRKHRPNKVQSKYTIVHSLKGKFPTYDKTTMHIRCKTSR